MVARLRGRIYGSDAVGHYSCVVVPGTTQADRASPISSPAPPSATHVLRVLPRASHPLTASAPAGGGAVVPGSLHDRGVDPLAAESAPSPYVLSNSTSQPSAVARRKAMSNKTFWWLNPANSRSAMSSNRKRTSSWSREPTKQTSSSRLGGVDGPPRSRRRLTTSASCSGGRGKWPRLNQGWSAFAPSMGVILHEELEHEPDRASASRNPAARNGTGLRSCRRPSSAGVRRRYTAQPIE